MKKVNCTKWTMTRYKQKHLDGSTTHKSTNIKVGDFVRSHYRAPWYGTVINIDQFGVAEVRMELNRHGGPMRKQKTMRLHVAWLERLADRLY